MSEREKNMNPQDPDDPDFQDERELQEEQEARTKQIIETGAITTTKGRHVIHCLTIVGQIVMVDNDIG